MRTRSLVCSVAFLFLLLAVTFQPESVPLSAQTATKAKKPSYVLFPRKLEDIKKVLAAIENAPPPKSTAEVDIERDKALRRLKAYRYLAEVPYQNVTLDDQFNKWTDAGAALCEKIGKLDHKPANPGLPEAEYKLGFKGVSSSNLAPTGNLVSSVDMYMNDSDPTNIDRVGHRRWCLNPAMMKTGFGKSGNYSAMYSFDTSQPRLPDVDAVCFPARGYMPVEFFNARYAWSVSLNGAKFKPPDAKTTKANIYEADADGLKTGEALKLDYTTVNLTKIGTSSCIIFRPAKIDIAAGKRYVVEIEGVVGARPGPFAYLVEFVTLKE